MKKQLLSLAASALLIMGCTPSGVNVILDGCAPDDSVLVYIYSFSGSDNTPIIDTLAAPNGKLFIEANYDKAKSVQVYKYPKMNPDSTHQSFRMQPVFAPLLPGANITISGSIDEFTVKGNRAFYDECNDLELKLKPYKDSVNALLAQMNALDPEFEKEQRRAIFNQIFKYKQPVDSIVFDYVKNNPNRESALYLLHKNTRPMDAKEYLTLFTQEVREGAFSELYEKMQSFKNRDRRYGKKDTQENNAVADGAVAPDFTLTDSKGQKVSLSSLRGKYLVLDFWGTWCGWCIKGIPEMKKMYSKYSDRLEIVGVACGDKENVWKKCISENEMNWTNLIMLECDANIPQMYSVKGYPTKVIIDPEGRVIKTVVGESPEFYTFIDELMKK